MVDTPLWSGERRGESQPLKIRLFPTPRKGYNALLELKITSRPSAARWDGRAVLNIAQHVFRNLNREENLRRCRAYKAVVGRD